jgi:hypothetical protein
VVSVVFHMWVVRSGRTGHTGYIYIVLCHSHVMVGSSTVTGLDIKDMWSMLFLHCWVVGSII